MVKKGKFAKRTQIENHKALPINWMRKHGLASFPKRTHFPVGWFEHFPSKLFKGFQSNSKPFKGFGKKLLFFAKVAGFDFSSFASFMSIYLSPKLSCPQGELVK